MKKTIAKFMAGFMAFTYAIPSIGVVANQQPPNNTPASNSTAYESIAPRMLLPGATTQQFIANLGVGLSPGTETQTPVPLVGQVPDNMGFIQFNTNSRSLHSWRIQYTLTPDKKVIIEFDRRGAGQNLYVTYSVVNPVDYSPIDIHYTGFNIHNSSVFMLAEEYLNTNQAPGGWQRDPYSPDNLIIVGNPNQVVLNHTGFPAIPDPDNAGSYLHTAIPPRMERPEFRISQHLGAHGFTFSFGINPSPVSIRWENEIVTITSQNFEMGRMHSVSLYEGPTQAAATLHDTIFITTGLINVLGTPFANTNRNSSHVQAIDRRYGVAGTDPYWPADPNEPAGVTLSFDLPLDFAGNVPSMHVGANINLHTPGYQPIIITIPNIFAPVPTGSSASGILGGVTRTVIGDRHILNIRLEGLQPGRLFHDNSSISLITAGGIYTRDTQIPWPKLFTFPHFEVRMINGLPFVAVTPFGLPGQYMLKHEVHDPGNPVASSTDPFLHLTQFSATVNSPNGDEEVILIPVPSQIITSHHGLFLQVYFIPNGTFATDAQGQPTLGGAQSFVFSQKLLYSVPPIVIGVRPPAFLNVVTYTHAPTNFERDRGLLDLSITLDVGDAAIINQLFNRDAQLVVLEEEEDEYGVMQVIDSRYEIVIYYELRNALSPYPGTAYTHFATVRATFFANNRTAPVSAILELVTPSHESVTLTNEGETITLGEVGFEGTVRHSIFMNFEIDTTHRLHSTSTNYAFNFPNIYFLNVSPVYNDENISSSVFASITLNEFDRTIVPPPQAFRITPNSYTSIDTPGQEQVSFDVEFVLPAAELLNYLRRSYGLDPLDANIFINLYINTDEAFMRSVFTSSDTEETQTSLTAIFNRHQHGRVTSIMNPLTNPLPQPTPDAEVETFFFSGIRGNTSLPNAPLAALRNDNLVALRRIPIYEYQLQGILSGSTPNTILFRYRLDGLDFNTEYFLTADIEVHQFDGDDFELKAISHFAPVITVTTPDPIDIPLGIEQNPPAPTPLNSRDILLDSATIYFNRVTIGGDLPTGYTETIDYEFIRIRGNQMDSSMMNNRNSMGVLWQHLVENHSPVPTGVTAFRTHNSQGANPSIQSFNGTSWVAAPNVSGDFTAAVVAVTDSTLESNTIYFYYVRTIREITRTNGEVIRRYSVFNHITITTTIVDAPRNLLAETGETLSNGNPNIVHNRMNEVVISFEALIANLANLAPNNIFFEYRIQIDDEEWGNPVAFNLPSLITGNEARPENWRWFFYHINSGIEPGRMHRIQVRTVQIDQSGRRSVSVWTLPAEWLAEPDPEAEEREREEDDWENHVREELYRLLRRPYWVMRDDNQVFSSILRPSLFGEMVRSATGRRIYLPTSDVNPNQTVYYIPASVFARLVQEEAAFILRTDSVDLTLPNRIIDLNNNPAVLTIADAVRRREVNDYMVRLNVNWQQGPTISGTPAISPVANISLHLVAATENIRIWDEELLESLLEMIDDLIEIAMERILASLAREDQNIITARHVLDIIEEAQREITRIAANHFRPLPTRTPIAVSFNSDMLLNVRNVDEEAVVNAYEWRNSAWARIPSAFNNNRGIRVPGSGSFVFTGRQIVIAGLASTPGAGTTRAIVARHGLDDFLGGANIDTNDVVTRVMLIDSIARILGAEEGANAAAFLRNASITIPPGNQTAPITTQEALSLVMAVYANRTNTPVSSIRITNFTLTNNLTGLSPQFAESFRAAIEVGIYRNYNLTPNAALTVGEMLDVLTNLDRLIGGSL
ncbi:MAG: hypothetical protein FWF50_07725 [Defluviitaleaceae bacterium]|nr:hypothetical protein [Defluviitaleaceae bacterium]